MKRILLQEAMINKQSIEMFFNNYIKFIKFRLMMQLNCYFKMAMTIQ